MEIGRFTGLGNPQSAVGYGVVGSEGAIGRVVGTHRVGRMVGIHRHDLLLVDTGPETRAVRAGSVQRVDRKEETLLVPFNRADISGLPIVPSPGAQRKLDEKEIERIERELPR